MAKTIGTTAKLTSAAPNPARILVRGPPGVEVDQICHALCVKTGLINISVSQLVKREVARKTSLGRQLGASACVDNIDALPTDAFVRLVSQRLREKDCVTKGWVLVGVPAVAHAKAMEATPFRPSRCVELEVPKVRATERAEGWTVDTNTNTKYHTELYPATPNIPSECLLPHPKADPVLCQQQIDDYYKSAESFENLYDKRLVSINADRGTADILDSLVHVLRTT